MKAFFRAEDGTEFDSEEKALAYEEKVKLASPEPLLSFEYDKVEGTCPQCKQPIAICSSKVMHFKDGSIQGIHCPSCDVLVTINFFIPIFLLKNRLEIISYYKKIEDFWILGLG